MANPPGILVKKKNPPANAGDMTDTGLISGPGRPPGGGHGSHSSILAWKIPWTEGPGYLQSIGWQRARHDQRDLACTYTTRDTPGTCWPHHKSPKVDYFLFYLKTEHLQICSVFGIHSLSKVRSRNLLSENFLVFRLWNFLYINFVSHVAKWQASCFSSNEKACMALFSMKPFHCPSYLGKY